MITKVFATNFKGLTFETALAEKNLFIGANGSGKSARSQALQLFLLGYVPAEKPHKKPGDIHAAFATGKKVEVGIELNGSEYRRIFNRTAKGTVSQTFMVDTGKYKKDDFMKAIGSAPTVLDLSTFMELSDQKKIDHLFQLFPPAGNVRKMLTDIETLNTDIGAKQMDIHSKEKVIRELSRQKSKIEMPAGTLAEVQAEIEQTTAAYKKAQENLSAAKEAEAKRKADEEARAKAAEMVNAERNRIAAEAKEKAEAEAKKRADAEIAAAKQRMEEKANRQAAGLSTPVSARGQAIAQGTERLRRQASARGVDIDNPPQLMNVAMVIGSFEKIIETAQRVNAMAVVLVARREMQKYMVKEAA